MEVISHTYERARRNFGVRPAFQDVVHGVDSIIPETADAKQWREKNTRTIELDCTPSLAQHTVNTERYAQQPRGFNHTEGAWYTEGEGRHEVIPTEAQDKQRLLRRLLNEETYAADVMDVCKTAEAIIQQNNAIDLYEMYFDNDTALAPAVPPACEALCMLRDPSPLKRSVTCISWHPDNPNKLAVAYSIQQFQQAPPDLPVASYVWDYTRPNQPEMELLPPSPLCCLAFNPRTPDHLIGGCYNGQIVVFDLRKGSQPIEVSPANLSHQDPVYQVAWVQSRSGTEFVSVSTDGQLLWWDSRKLDKGPLDNMTLSLPNNENELTYGATRLDYRADAGATRYLVATEQGHVLLCDRKAKKDKGSDKTVRQIYGDRGGCHTGPITSVQRNPHPNMLKYFLTVGDWTARVWNEDCKTPVLITPYDSGYVLDAAWSPSRSGLFYTAKSDGTVDAWDLALRHNKPALSVRVSDLAVCTVQPQWVLPANATHHKVTEVTQGLLAVGDVKGTVTLLRTNIALNFSTKDDRKEMIEAMEREAKREKACEVRLLAKRRENKEKEKESVSMVDMFGEDDPALMEILKKAEAEFFAELESSNTHNDEEEEEEVKEE